MLLFNWRNFSILLCSLLLSGIDTSMCAGVRERRQTVRLDSNFLLLVFKINSFLLLMLVINIRAKRVETFSLDFLAFALAHTREVRGETQKFFSPPPTGVRK
jgi:hypothetical protein